LITTKKNHLVIEFSNENKLIANYDQNSNWFTFSINL